MAFLPGYSWDLFVSYAHRDQQWATSAKGGWVSEFVDRLTALLSVSLADRVSVYHDRDQIHSFEPIERTERYLENSALMLVLASPSYAASEWTRRELDAFLQSARDPRRLMVVELMPLKEGQSYPSALDQKLRYEMWHRDPQADVPVPLMPGVDRRYSERVIELAIKIKDELLRLREQKAAAVRSPSGSREMAPDEGPRGAVAPRESDEAHGSAESHPRPARAGRRIFISYAREDKRRITPLVELLEKKGHVVWWDRHVPWGSSYQKAITAELQAADIILVVWSKNSVHSDPVLEEADIGKERQCLRPVKIDQVTLPFGFRLYQALDLTEWSGAENDEAVEDLLKKLA